MKKHDLKNGMFVSLTNGHLYMVYHASSGDSLVRPNGYVKLASLDSDMIQRGEPKNKTVERIYGITTGGVVAAFMKGDEVEDSLSLLWKRRETRKLTVAQIAEKLGYDVEIVEG